MGADGSVTVYDYEKVDNHHRQTYGHGILEDWTYLRFGTNMGQAVGIVTLGNKDYILDYWNTECETHNTSDECHMEDTAAHKRVMATLEAVGDEDNAEVWT